MDLEEREYEELEAQKEAHPSRGSFIKGLIIGVLATLFLSAAVLISVGVIRSQTKTSSNGGNDGVKSALSDKVQSKVTTSIRSIIQNRNMQICRLALPRIIMALEPVLCRTRNQCK